MAVSKARLKAGLIRAGKVTWLIVGWIIGLTIFTAFVTIGMMTMVQLVLDIAW